MEKNRLFRWIFLPALVSVFLMLSGCSGKAGSSSSPTPPSAPSGSTSGTSGQEKKEDEPVSGSGAPVIDYQVLVNKNHPLPEGWEDAVDFVHITNSLGDDLSIERNTYAAYLKLHDQLARDGIDIDIGSAWRSAAEQQEFADSVSKEYGEKDGKRYAALPGYSEHQTGLALDLYLKIDGKEISRKEELEEYPEIWEEIHDQLAQFGFILRYPEGSEEVTGYAYKPWHIRYVEEKAAREITAQEITLEEYLGLDDL